MNAMPPMSRTHTQLLLSHSTMVNLLVEPGRRPGVAAAPSTSRLLGTGGDRVRAR